MQFTTDAANINFAMIYLTEVAVRHSSHQEIKVCRIGSEMHKVYNSVERVQ